MGGEEQRGAQPDRVVVDCRVASILLSIYRSGPRGKVGRYDRPGYRTLELDCVVRCVWDLIVHMCVLVPYQCISIMP